MTTYTATRTCPLCGKRFLAANSTQRQASADALESMTMHVDRAHQPKEEKCHQATATTS